MRDPARPPQAKMFDVLIPVFLGANFSSLAAFFVLRWLSLAGEIEFVDTEVLAVFLYLFILAFFSYRSRQKQNLRTGVLLWHVCQFGLILFFLVAEVFFYLFPQWIPKTLVNTNPSLLYVRRHQDDLLDHLSENPWIKFRSNTLIRSYGDRGRDFINAWMTDEQGFKNEPGFSGKPGLAAVAIGDSFTEAMGSPLEKTWETLVTKAGFPVYNLGVQGYAPTQTAGVYKLYGTRMAAPIVILGYTPGFERRELNFPDRGKPPKNAVFTGGIQSINDYMHEERAKYRYFKFTNTCLHFLKETIRAPLKRFAGMIRDPERAKSRFYPYKDFVMEAAKTRYNLNNREFERSRQAILAVQEIATRRGQKVVLLLYTLRSWAYYEKVLGHEPPPDHFETAVSTMIGEFCRQREIDVIDTHGAIKRYVDRLNDTGDPSELPYFEIDGHHNLAGNQIVAEEVLSYLKGRANPKKGSI
ncbi:MAG: hypothetical protein HYT89_03860 [Candidatus Omnitrophica bacterium]|nr:hypothetical protein [Candidatus Omnitrophota bacterium]